MNNFHKLLEYLTDDQRMEYSKHEMTPEARKATDHFFGKDSDVVHGTLDTSETHHSPKSEVHQRVETHLGKDIPVENYAKGMITDRAGRPQRLGRAIKDEKLRNEFASDRARALGSKPQTGYTTSTHRGTEVAGQTNTGHSWADQSCKNIEDGCNRSFLSNEIKHGTVAHFVHDDKGKEIYRSTLQPHHNFRGDTSYHLDSEYGVMHPAFTKSSNDVASKLSGEYKDGLFKIHPKVYNNSGSDERLHPNATAEHITKVLDDATPSGHTSGNIENRAAAVSHPNATPEHISRGLDDQYTFVRKTAVSNPNATSEHINKGLDDRISDVRSAAVNHPNATSEHIGRAMDDPHTDVRATAVSHPHATAEHITKGLEDDGGGSASAALKVRRAAIGNPNATPEHITKALRDDDADVRALAVKHPNATQEHINKGLNDEEMYVRKTAKNRQTRDHN
jgi:hypothetical protein